MNLQEFKAWFEGFTENLDGTPTAKQWKRIQEKIGKIVDAPPVPVHVFHDHYYKPWARWYGPIYSTNAQAYGLSLTCGAVGQQLNVGAVGQNSVMYAASDASITETFDSGTAFKQLGRAEAASLAPRPTA